MSLTIKKLRWLGLGLSVVMLSCLWGAAQAQAGHVYWSKFGGTTIGNIKPDGSEAQPSFISGASNPVGVAVSGVHLYWANTTADTIGRANLDGSGVDNNFITGINPTALAVAKGHIYWTNADAHTIGRAKLDGSGAEEGFIGNVGSFFGLAADPEHLYWGNPDDEAIGRADLDGFGVDKEFIETAGLLIPYGVAVDAGHVYWANAGNDAIGRAQLDGGGIEEAFIPGAHPAGLAVDRDHVYWGYATFGGAIGRANIDGSGIDTSFYPGVLDAFGLATTVPPATLSTTASPDVTLGTAIHATAVLVGANAPTGSITFSLYGPNDETCSGIPLKTEAVAVSGNGSYEGAGFTPAEVGVYRWTASYSGDAENKPLSGTCSEAVRIGKPTPSVAGSATSASSSAKACTLVSASAATFAPTPRAGRLIPGVRAMITVGTPSQLQVEASLTYKVDGKARSLALGSHALHASPSGKLRLSLPAGLRSAPTLGTRVNVKLWISATPDGLAGCAPPSVSTRSFKARVVRVLASTRS
ncbi:MAG TPA: hypothetical protein VGO66_01250 [Solirubrobacterales bacterium]|jgi:streptogramin lyase|nr:hypothetical protein [Solirubrobacterales bacterium]